MAIAGSYKTPSASFCIINRRLVQIGTVVNRPDSALARADDAATHLLFDPHAVLHLDARRGTAEHVLRLRLVELGAIDE